MTPRPRVTGPARADRRRPRRLRRGLAALAAVSLLATAAGCGTSAADAPPTARQQDVARKGASVMPFDLERTTHRFVPVDDGLRQEVVSDTATDAEQVRLIREHLTHEAERFRRGDYADPARIHGAGMPGLRELSAGSAGIEVSYSERPDGAALRFRTADPALVDALHRWGAAQVADHGEHAEH
ncbi:aspartate carbamoyltransferase [Streptomyces sp. NPDC015127]|uniref:aspartate carbamoyltransferase n=1 Tax=Streptomyces sp. NPDC015127 TaxID=3364939 RepID=UPI0036F8298C